jgi:putative inorganic carbon (hco3(-)) transporter
VRGRLSWWLLLLFAFLTPFISPAYIVFGLLLIAWFADALRERRLPGTVRSPLFFVAGLLALFTALSGFFSTDPAITARHLPGLSLLLILPIAMDLVRDAARARALVFALVGGAGAESLLAVWQFLHGGAALGNRIRGTLSHYMTFSGLAMIAGCVLLGFLFEARGRRRAVGVLAAVPMAALLLTYTRGAYVGVAAALVAYLAVRRPKGLLVALPVLAAIVLLAPASVRARMFSIADVTDTTNRDRIAMLRAGMRMVADRPLLGVGPNLLPEYYPLYREPDAPRWRVPHLHDNLAEIAASSGVFAAAAYVLLVAFFLVRALRLVRGDRDPERAPIWAGALLAGVALSIAGLFEYNFGDTEVEMATLLVFALPFSRFAAALPRG